MGVTMGHGTGRVRALVGDNAAIVVTALVILGLFGAYVTAGTYVTPATRTETVTTSSWESTGEFGHRATVVNGTEAIPEGTVLRNRSVYFRKASPTLNGSFGYEYAASDGGDLATEVSLALVLRSVAERRDGNETIYWRVEKPIDSTSTDSLRAGQRVRVPFSTNVTGARERAVAIEEQFGNTPGTPEIGVVARVNLSGTRNGRGVDRTRVYRLPIHFEQGIYRVEDDGPAVEGGEQTRETAVPVTYGIVRRLGGPALLFAAIAGIAGLAFARWTGRLTVSEAERRRLDYRDAREEFDDWITTATVPPEVTAGAAVEVESLPGLVDAAIDMDERVIEDRDDDRFVVFGDGINYVYVPPASSRAPGTSSETTATEGTGDPDRESASERRTTAAAAKQNGDDSPS